MPFSDIKAAWLQDVEFKYLGGNIVSRGEGGVEPLCIFTGRRAYNMLMSSIQIDHQKQIIQEACGL